MGRDMRDQLLHDLKTGVVVVEFMKLNGDKRVMRCTRMEALIPPSAAPSGTGSKEECLTAIKAYDPDAKGWRSFVVANVTLARPQTSSLPSDYDRDTTDAAATIDAHPVES